MEILLLSDGIAPFSFGGIQRHTQLMLRYLLEEGHDLTFYYCTDNHQAPSNRELLKSSGLAEPEKYLERFNDKHFVFPSATKFPGHYLRSSKAYSKLLFEEYLSSGKSYDFIYAQGFCSWYFAEHISKVKDKLAVNFHGFEMYQKPAGKFGLLKNWMLRLPVKAHLNKRIYWLSLGKGISDIIHSLGVSPELIIENPSGIEAEWLRPKEVIRTSDHAVRFLFIGRYERRKGIEEISDVLRDNPNFHFEFVGPIPESLQVNQDNVLYHGKLSDKEKLISIIDTCDLIVAPSYSEGLPNVIMEAMARGLAILCTKVGANTSIAQKENSWYVKAGDSTDLLAKMEQIEKSPKESIFEKKKASREIIEAFVWPKPIIELINKLNATAS